MNRGKRIAVELGGVAGVGLLALGFYLAWPPLGFIAGGVMLLMASIGAANARW